MGESKISVFRHLFGEEEKAQYANTAFEQAYGALVDGGRIAPVPGRGKPSSGSPPKAVPSF